MRERRAAGTAPYRLILVVTDGVFSMDGDIAPLAGIVEAAEAYDAAVFVDDAHAVGVLGHEGRGTVNHFGLRRPGGDPGGTLSKAVGVLGGYVAGSQACATSSCSGRGRSCSRRRTRPPWSPHAARRSR